MKALVLSGGGSAGAFQVGVLRYLVDNENVEYDIHTGISVGALNSALLASGTMKETLPLLENIWLTQIKGNHSIWTHHILKYIILCMIVVLFFASISFVSFLIGLSKIITISFGIITIILLIILPYFTLKNTHSAYKTEPLRKLIDLNINISKLRSNNKKLQIGAVSFLNGKYVSINKNDSNIKDWIMASSAFPIFFPMQKINNEYYIDGGFSNSSCVKDAINLGATEIDLILTSSLNPSLFYGNAGIPRQILRSLDIINNEVLQAEFKTELKNKNVKIRIFRPSHNLTLNILSFKPNKIQEMYEKGLFLKEEF